MDDAVLEGDANLETPQQEDKELSVLQAIIDDGRCDVGTQTIKIRSDSRVTQFSPPEDKLNQGINISHRPSSRSKKSSFRLFIVPDDPDSDAFHDSGLRLSFDEGRHGSDGQSLHFSVTSNEPTEPFHDSKNIRKTKISRYTSKQNEFTSKGTASSVSLEKDNRDATIDHQLMHSTNPSVLAWLKLKNFEERNKRRLEKKEKKELRRHAYEEAEKRQKHIEESEKQFAQWLTAKKKEARRAWREKCARKRVDTVGNEHTIRKDDDPPPNYTVVPTFKGDQAWAGGEEVSLNIGRTNETLQTQTLKTDNGEHYNKRPATADSRLLSVSGRNSKLSKRNTQEKWPKQGSNYNKRPTTSGGRLTSNTGTMVDKGIKGINHKAWEVQKRKEQKSNRPTTAHAYHLNFEDDRKPAKKSITFEAWKAQKRQESKTKAKQKKQEVVDDALTEAIIKMARRRVENSCKEKRQLDTGIPKWRAKNRVRTSSGEKNVSVSNTSHSKYAVIQLLGNEQDNHETQETGSQAKEVAALRKSCENLKLH